MLGSRKSGKYVFLRDQLAVLFKKLSTCSQRSFCHASSLTSVQIRVFKQPPLLLL